MRNDLMENEFPFFWLKVNEANTKPTILQGMDTAWGQKRRRSNKKNEDLHLKN